MPDAPRPCTGYPDLVAFDFPLPHLAKALKAQRKIKIVAIGSSSTAGADKVIPFPPRLELALRTRYYGRMIDVLNRGIGGQEAPEELSRLECDVIAEAPTLVIWQVGTNAIYRSVDYSPDDVKAAIVTGLGWLAGLPMDVVLMDSQYTTAIVNPANIEIAERIEAMISAAAEVARVNLFRRFALMRRWCLQDNIPLADMDDGADAHLHTSDWATNCITLALDRAIGEAPPPPAPPSA